MKKILFIAALFASIYVQGQELSQGYYNYILNRFNLNPAFAGNNGNISAILNTKSLMTDFNGAPNNTMFGVHGAISQTQGIGARIFSDKRGAYEVNKYDAAYSYQIKLDKKSDLRFGISAGIINRQLNVGNLKSVEYLNQNDPVLAGDYYNETSFIAGAGLVYDYDNLQVGISAPNLIEGSKDISDFMVGTISYEYQLSSSKIDLTPIVIYQNLPEATNSYDALLKASFAKKVYALGGYKSNQNLLFGLGFDLGPFGIAYAYELPNSNLQNVSDGSHDIALSIGFLAPKQQERLEMITKLDSYISKFDKMLNDESDSYNKSQVYGEINNIRAQLLKLKGMNDKSTARVVENRLNTIETQISALELKYKK